MKVLKLEKSGSIATLTFCRPDSLNAVGLENDGETFLELSQEINRDTNISVVIITGEGRAFSAGGDIKSMKERKGNFSGSAYDIRQAYKNNVHKMVRAIWNIEVPIIAAINGPAVGFGCDIACMSDIRLASTEAKFGLTFLKIGLIPGDGGAWLTPKIIGISRAAQMLYTGEIIDAQKALDWNLVSEVFAPDELMDAAYAMAQKIASQPPQALRMTKSSNT